MRDPVQLLAFGFGSGLSPRAPGTAGSVAAILPFLMFQHLPLWQYAAVVFVAMLAGFWICGEASRRLKVHDHPGIVWDEFVGLWIALFALPAGWLWIALGFLLFRVFDILKPWPINWLDQHVEGGVGIMVDDVLAGFMACACLQLANYYGLLDQVLPELAL
ncbi:MAG: phosphatidylglycerophosphatase A [Congregibacter sp.]